MIATLLIGYSLFSSVVIIAAHFRNANYAAQRISQITGILLLFVLAGMQIAHLAYLEYGVKYIHEPFYRSLLFAVAPTFYLFSKPLLRAQDAFKMHHLLHLLPIFASPLLPYRFALPLAFAIGAGYLLWLALSVYSLRAQRSRFRLELGVLGSVFVIALVVVVLGMSLPILGEQHFYQLYASAIGCAFLLVSFILGIKPRLAGDIAEVSRETYIVSTLTHVDCDVVLENLDSLMEHERMYQQPELSLASLAQKIGLSSHQLSELINTRMGKSFSRYLREYRIEAAKRMLLAETSASVMSVGLSVGFTSQSNFYDAFREITGMTPGKFRKIRRANSSE